MILTRSGLGAHGFMAPPRSPRDFAVLVFSACPKVDVVELLGDSFSITCRISGQKADLERAQRVLQASVAERGCVLKMDYL